MLPSNGQRIRCLTVACLLLLAGSAVGGRSPKPEALKLVEQGRLLHRSGHLDSAIVVLQQATRVDRRCGDAWNELALAYMDLGTLQGRIKATHALERALRLDWHNPDYNYNMGVLHMKKGMPSAAASYFKKILKRHPDHARAYYQLGRIEEEKMLRYKDMISPQEEGVIFYLTEFAEKDRLKAENYYRRAIALDPGLSDAYYRLALIQYEVRNLDGMIDLLQRALRATPDSAISNRKDYYLFLGLAYHRKGEADAAFDAFQTARSLMGREELALFDSVEVVMSPKMADAARHTSDSARRGLRERFWRQRDPLFLTRLNERLLEHYSRIAYANLRFSFPEKGIVGWQTDRGKTLIRFGEPEVLFRTRPSMEITFGGGNPINSSKEYWGYPDFHIVFDDEYLNGNYRFKRSFYPEDDYRYQFEELIEETPDYYRHDYGGETFEVPRVVANFQANSGRTRVELFYGVPGHRIALRQEGGLSVAHLKRGVFFFDSNWVPVSQDVGDRRLVLSTKVDTTEPVYLIDRQVRELPPGSYRLALELVDPESHNVGIVRDQLEVRSFGSETLQISDLLLASTIQSDRVRPVYALGGMEVVPNLFGAFSVRQPVYVYFEIYNLRLTEGGLSRYRVEHVVRPRPRSAGLVSRIATGIGSLFGRRSHQVEETSTSFEYVGDRPTASHYNSIQLGSPRPGSYELIVRVTDLVSGATTQGQASFELVNEGESP